MQIDCEKNLDSKEESDVLEPEVRIMSKLENLNDAVDQSTFIETNDATFTERLSESDSMKLEPKTIPDSVDDVSVIQELNQSHGEFITELSEPDVNAPLEAEARVATEFDLLSNGNLNSSELDEAINVDLHEPNQRSPSTSCGITEDDGVFCEPSSDHCIGDLDMDNYDILTVVLCADYMEYRDSYCTNCALTFTSNCVKVEGSTLDADDKTFKFQWPVENMRHIKYHWYQMVGMVMVTIHVVKEDTVEAENVESTPGGELKFALIANNWYGSMEAITSLNAAYKPLWRSMLELEDNFQASFPKYFPIFDQPFEEVIYPKGDVDAVSISKREVDMLLPDTFVNDTIIDFYIKYLKNKINPEERQRFHFFNSFFFRKLADPDKDPLDASQGKVAFQRVRKWTRKVNLFEKDYVFIPVNYNYHWSLIVMCHLGEVATYKDEEDVTELTKVPCVLHMDSIRGSHSGLKGLMQSYLKEEWKARLQESSEDISSKFDNLRFISLELPQQPNSFDCGLFLLHYVELFLEQAPINFNPFKVTKSVNFLNVDWFPPADASLKRVVIERLVDDLLEKPCHEAPSMAANGEHRSLSSPPTANLQKGSVVNFFPETSMAGQSCREDQGLEMSLLPSISMASEEDHLKPTFDEGSFLGMQFPSFNDTTYNEYKSSLAPQIEEDNGQFVYCPTEIGVKEENEGEDYKNMESCWQQNNNFQTSPETSISGCEEVINGTHHQINNAQLDFNQITDQQPPIETLDADADANANGLTFSLKRCEMEVNNKPTGSDESLSGLESDVQHPAKRMRMEEPTLELDAGSA